MPIKSVMLLSAGLDSSLNLYEAHRAGEVLLALTFDYGQRAALREIECSKKLCHRLSVPHQILDVRWLGTLGGSALTSASKAIPQGGDIQIDNHKRSTETARLVWVPNRNGVFLNIGAAFAESLGADHVVPGFNVEEAATFPDNSAGFLESLTKSFRYSTSSQIKAHCYTTTMNKTEIVQRGRELGLAFSDLWPCYFAGEKWCGQCESCLRFVRAGGAAAAEERV